MVSSVNKKRLNPRQKNILRKCIRIAIIVAIVLIITLLYVLVPFRTLLPAYSIAERKEGELRIHFLYVGQGDCSIVEFPDGELLLIDGGDGAWDKQNKLIRYVKGLKAEKISYVITHADVDHYGGFQELIRIFGADTVYLPVKGSWSGDYQALLDQVERSGAAVQTLSRYDVIAHSSGAYLNCISPYSEEYGEDNDSSAVLYLSYQGTNVLFTGDITSDREKLLAEEYSFDHTLFDKGVYRVRLEEAHILKVAHHGSASSSSRAWLKLLGAQTAIVSCGRGNEYSHPSFYTLARLKEARPDCEIYRTDELGDVMVHITQNSYTVTYGEE